MEKTAKGRPRVGLPGEMPVIGIRPAIDGRLGGVRESLENKTMEMALQAADLIGSNLRHSNGEEVLCIMADRCIGGAAEARMADEKFRRTGVQVTLTVTPCWCYGTETMDIDPMTIKAVWGFNGTERPGAVYLAAVLAAHAQKGLPAYGIYGRDVQDAGEASVPPDVREKILSFARAGIAVARMRGTSYLSVGSVSMGIAGSQVNESFFQNYLGMRTEYLDMSEMLRRMNNGIYDREEYDRAIRWVKAGCREGLEKNRDDLRKNASQKAADWESCVKMTIIMRDMMHGNERLAAAGFGEEALGHAALASGFQGQRQWTDFMPNGDFMEAMLTSSFDWNGMREPLVVATENDSLNAAAMLFGHLLTNSASVFADVRTYWSPDAYARVTGEKLPASAGDGLIHLINSGPASLDGTGRQNPQGAPVMKPFWEITEQEADECLGSTRWCPANREYFPGGGFSSSYLTRGGMPITMVRVNLVAGLGPVIQLAEGHSVDLPKKAHDILNRRTDETWPTTWFAPRLTGSGPFRDTYGVMAAWGANHCSFNCGHIGADIITLASALRIPVSMHNVPAEKIFRPAAWNSFGMDAEGSDYRACAAYGPLYA
jgi:L-fucose/D-arabinose isomerase